MKKIVISIICLMNISALIAQLDAVGRSFQNCENDTAFVVKNSVEALNTITFEMVYKADDSPAQMIAMLDAPLGTVVGPILENGRKVYLKSISADSTNSMHVAHIFVSHSMHPEGDAEKIIRDAFDKLKSGATWTSVVDEFSEDGTVQTDGDLGWFGEGVMVPAFENACLKMKKGDKSIVKTEFGWHIIWMKSQPKKTRKSVECLRLVTY